MALLIADPPAAPLRVANQRFGVAGPFPGEGTGAFPQIRQRGLRIFAGRPVKPRHGPTIRHGQELALVKHER